MRKTIILALAALATAVSATAADYTVGDVTYTTQTGILSGNDKGTTADGFTFTLSNDLFEGAVATTNTLTTATGGATSFTATVALSSIKLVERNNESNYTSPTSALASSILKITDASGTLVATSTTVTANASSFQKDVFGTDGYSRRSYTWTFTPESSLLTVGNSYTVKIYSVDADTQEETAISFGYVLAYNGSSDLATVAGLSDYLPGGMVITTLSAVPEPATATLSLLALAGLAARRRRK